MSENPPRRIYADPPTRAKLVELSGEVMQHTGRRVTQTDVLAAVVAVATNHRDEVLARLLDAPAVTN